jgi:hypothetical protein
LRSTSGSRCAGPALITRIPPSVCDPLALHAGEDADGIDDDPNAADHPVVAAANWHGAHCLGLVRSSPTRRSRRHPGKEDG